VLSPSSECVSEETAPGSPDSTNSTDYISSHCERKHRLPGHM